MPSTPGPRTRNKRKLKTIKTLNEKLGRVWNCHEVKIIPIVIGALGTVPKGLIKGLETLEMTSAFDLLQKACLPGSARIFRKVGLHG